MKIKDLKYLLLSAIIFTIAVFMQRQFLLPEDYVIETQAIEKNLHALEKETDIIIEDLIVQIPKAEKVRRDSSTTWLIDSKLSGHKKKGLLFFIYENDSLRYWSDNSLPVPNLFAKSSFGKNSVAELSGGWYEIRTKKVSGNIVLVGLIKLRSKYLYQNKYLENGFNPKLEMPSIVRISPVPLAHGKNIKNVSGEYAFSIVPVAKVISKTDTSGKLGLLYFLSFAFLLLYFHSLLVKYEKKPKSGFVFFGVLLALLGLRYAMITYQFPLFLYSLRYFEPEITAGGKLFPFLGDYLLNSMLIVFFTANFFRFFNIQKKLIALTKEKRFMQVCLIAVFLVLAWIYFTLANTLIEELISNSNIPFIISDITTLNTFSFTAYVSIGLLLLSFLLLADEFFKIINEVTSLKLFASVAVPTVVLLLLTSLFTPYFQGFYALGFFSTSLLSIAIIRFHTEGYPYFALVILIFISTVFTTVFVSVLLEEKQVSVQRLLVDQLVDERDDIAEHLLREVEKRLNKDEVFVKYLQTAGQNQEQVMSDYLQQKYFNGYWKKYGIKLYLCGNSDYFRDENKISNCDEAYQKQVSKSGTKVKNSNFYFLNNRNGTITYSGKFDAEIEDEAKKITLYLSLNSKLISKELGYPELLLDEKNLKPDIFENYSFAKFQNGELVKKSGEYPYNLTDDSFEGSNRYSAIVQNKYIHTIFRPNDDSSLVLSREAPHSLSLLISFSYLFVFFNIAVFIGTLLVQTRIILKNFKPNFKNKIRFSMLVILLLAFVLFGGVTIYYTIQQHKKIQSKEMTDKIQSVLTEMEHKLSDAKELDESWHTDKYANLDELLVKFSQVFYSDINLYDLNGKLLASSRHEIFKRGLISELMNREAYNELVIKHRTQFIQNENIGELNYASIYIPFRNSENEITAYLNLPYFTNQESLRKDISSILVTVINIYVVLLLITIFAAFLISAQIVKPIILLKDKFKNVELGKKHQPIIYPREDEIGGLVREYNRMLKELSENMKKLASSERESAWREMAKQIAHEIKNPLTPMKLSIQLLERAWNDKKPDFDVRIAKVTHTVIEQIDTLSAIASEFSAFAKMPKAQDEEVDIAEKIQTIVQLFEHTRNTAVTLNLNDNKCVMIIADKEQLSRVFINLIKNGIQSVPDGIMGHINVDLITYANKVKVTIKDNGHGIPDDRKDKLFKPSFTTKTTGMGMGLAIVKNIIKNADGDIWFESEVGKGTEFFVEFPIMEGEG